MPKLLIAIYTVLIASSVTYFAVRPASDWHAPVDPFFGLTTEVDNQLPPALTAKYQKEIKDLTDQMSQKETANQYDLDLYYLRAHDEFALGQLKEAFNDYQKVIVGDPKNETAWGNLGDLRIAMGDVNGAEHDYQQSIAAFPDEIAYTKLYNYYLTYRKADRADRVEPLLVQAIKDVPGNSALYVDLARWQMQRKEYDAALNSYREAVQLDPKNTDLNSEMQKAIQLAGSH